MGKVWEKGNKGRVQASTSGDSLLKTKGDAYNASTSGFYNGKSFLCKRILDILPAVTNWSIWICCLNSGKFGSLNQIVFIGILRFLFGIHSFTIWIFFCGTSYLQSMKPLNRAPEIFLSDTNDGAAYEAIGTWKSFGDNAHRPKQPRFVVFRNQNNFSNQYRLDFTIPLVWNVELA